MSPFSKRFLLRSQQKPLATVTTLTVVPLLMLCSAFVGIWLLCSQEIELATVLGSLACFGLSGLLIYHLGRNYLWVECDGKTLRGRRFWTRTLVEQPVDRIAEIRPLGAAAKTFHPGAGDTLLGPIRGYLIRFTNGPRVYLMHHQMNDVDELVEALAGLTRRH